jgi:pyruvate carboxylase
MTPTNITAPVNGVIRQWFVLEGTHVKKGDNIVDIADIDPDIMTRLNIRGRLLSLSLMLHSKPWIPRAKIPMARRPWL